MSKPQFQNEKAGAVGGSLGLLGRVFLGLSSASSAIAICSSIILFIYPDSTPASAPIAWLLCLAIGIGVAVAIDFMLVERFGHFFFREFVAMCTRRFSFGILRSFNMLAIGFFFAIGFYLSYSTSSDGAVIAAGAAGIGGDAGQYAMATAARENQYAENIAPYKKSLEKVEKEIEDAKDKRKGKKLKKLIRKGNDWAMGEGAKIDKAVEKQHKDKLARAQKDYDDHKEIFGNSSASSLAALADEAKEKIKANKAKMSGLILMLEGFGVLPLFLGVMLIVIASVGEVNVQISKLPSPAQVAKQKRRKPKAKGAGIFDAMYTETPDPS